MEELLAQLLQQRALQTKVASDEKHGALVAQLRRTGNPPMADLEDSIQDLRTRAGGQVPRSAPGPGMPGNPAKSVQERSPEWYQEHGLPSNGLGSVTPPEIVAGAGAHTAAAMGWGPNAEDTKDVQRYRQEFSVAKPDPDPVPEDLVRTGAGYFDDQVMARRNRGEVGYTPELFKDATAEDAINLIAQQLRARRIRTLGEMDPEYIDSLPKY